MSTQNLTATTIATTASSNKPPVIKSSVLSQKTTTTVNPSNLTTKQVLAAGSTPAPSTTPGSVISMPNPTIKIEPSSNSSSQYSGRRQTNINNIPSPTKTGCSNFEKREGAGTPLVGSNLEKPHISQTSTTSTNQRLSQPQSMLKSHSMRNASTLNLEQCSQLGQQSPPPAGSHQMNRTRSVPVYSKPQPHPIAIKPRPIAIAPSPVPHKHGHHPSSHSHSSQLKSVGLMRNLSTMSNQGSEEITLTTSKNWVLPPRPKVKKSSSSRKNNNNNININNNNNNNNNNSSNTNNSTQANGFMNNSANSPGKTNGTSVSSPASGPGRTKINSQIHSNINLHTNNQLDLKIQLQNVSKENDNLKKILTKLRKEIGNLSLLKSENDKKLNSQSKTIKPQKTSKKSSTSNRSSIASVSSSSNSPLNASSISSMSISPTDTTLLSETNTIDPINLSYHLESKRPKTNKSSTPHLGMNKASIQTQRKINTPGAIGISAISGGSKDYYLSPKDIMIHPVPVALKKQEQGLNHNNNNNNNNLKSISPKATTKSRKKISSAFATKQDCGQCKKGHCQCLDTPSPTSLPPLAPKLLKKSNSKDSTVSKPRSKSKTTSSKSTTSKLQQKQLQKKSTITAANATSLAAAAAAVATTTTTTTTEQQHEKPVSVSKTPSSNLASEWFAKNPLLDFDMYNEDMSDIISEFTINSEMQNLEQAKSSLILDPTTNGTPSSSLIGNGSSSTSGIVNVSPLNNATKSNKVGNPAVSMVTAAPADGLLGASGAETSPKFEFRFDDNDDFMMY